MASSRGRADPGAAWPRAAARRRHRVSLETGKNRGLRGRLLPVDRVAERRVPAVEGGGELVVEDARAHL